MAAARRFDCPQHNRKQQNQRLARTRAAEQKQVLNRAPDQLQRQKLVVRKFKAVHKTNPFLTTETQRKPF